MFLLLNLGRNHGGLVVVDLAVFENRGRAAVNIDFYKAYRSIQ